MPQHARGKEEEKEREREGAEVVKGRAADPRSCIALPTAAGTTTTTAVEKHTQLN